MSPDATQVWKLKWNFFAVECSYFFALVRQILEKMAASRAAAACNENHVDEVS
jgi:hypothetical protein